MPGKMLRGPWTILAGLLLGLAAGEPAAGISLCDFRIPTTDLTHLFLTMNYTYLDMPATSAVDVSSGRFSFTFSHTHDEPDRALSVGSTSEFSFDRLELDRVLGDAYLTTRLYIQSDQLLYVFTEIKADYTGAGGQSGLELRLGSGYGRLTDVTPLTRALGIEDALIDDLVLTAPLTDEALQEIAGLIGREETFSGLGELVSRIEAILEAEADVTLNARSLLAIAERIRSSEISQQCGWTAQLGLGYELLPRFGSSRQLLLSVSTDLARPLTVTSQIEVRADLSRPLFVAGARALSGSVHYNRRLSESTRLVAEYAIQRLERRGDEPILGETIELQVLFDLGQVDLTASGSLTRGSGMQGWVESLVVSARVDLL